MKNFDEFEKELGELDRSGAGALKDLREQLRAISDEKLPGEQNQRWAWTRFEAHMRGWSVSAGKWWGVRSAGWATMTMLAVWVGVGMWGGPIGNLPVVTAVNPKMSAVTFYSPEADTDVIWVDGYDYMPDSYVIQ